MNVLADVFFQTPAPDVESYVTFPQFIAPFLPALIVAGSVVLIEYVCFWRHNSTRLNWWLLMALASLTVFEIIWDAWCSNTPIAFLVDSPDADGLQIRLQILVYGLLAIGMPLGMLYAGIRQTIAERELSGYAILSLRLLPAPATLALLIVRVQAALEIFAGVRFRVFG